MKKLNFSPPKVNIFDLLSSETIDQALLNLRLDLMAIYGDIFSDGSFEALTLRIQSEAGGSCTNRENLSEILDVISTQYGYVQRAYLVSPFLTAYISTWLSQDANERRDIDLAWRFLAGALHIVHGMRESIAPGEDARSKPGKQRGEKNKIVRERAIVLLNERRPENGWASKKQARQALESELATFIIETARAEGCKLAEHNIGNTLLRWMRKLDPVREAYESNAKEK